MIKIIKEKVKIFSFGQKSLIHANLFVDIIKNVLGKIRLNNIQLRMILNQGKIDGNGYINVDNFFKNIEKNVSLYNNTSLYKTTNRFGLIKLRSYY